MMQNKLATNNPEGYNEKRNFVQLFPEFKREKDFFSYCLAIVYKFTGKGYVPLLKGLFYNPFSNKKDKLYHFFNTVSLNNSPWVVTYETILPRLGDGHNRLVKKAIKKLAGDNCKKIIAMSDSAYELQLSHLKNNYPQYLKAIKKKMLVLHPSQKILLADYNAKQLALDKIVFTIIGADFFRKGGREILHVFDRMLHEHPHLSLKIVSAMQYGDYASCTTKLDSDEAYQIIEKYPDNIQLYTSLPNDKVLELLKETHVGLLPTWGDSYGYSVLESQAAGCPVISTDLRALPEINNDEIGWMIEVPKLATKNADIGTEEKRLYFQKVIEDKLEKIIRKILENPTAIKEKGIKALDKIKLKHNVEEVRQKLEEIYSDI